MAMSKCVSKKCEYHEKDCERHSYKGAEANMLSICKDNNYRMFEIDWNFYKAKFSHDSLKQPSEDSTEGDE